MTIIPLSFSIIRDIETQKKVYQNLATNEKSMKPSLPKDWQHTSSNKTSKTLGSYQIHGMYTPSYALRLDDDTIVIDCDSLDSTQAIDSLLAPSAVINNELVEHYITISDKGEKHFYFSTTNYYKDSLIYKDARLALGKIDILHGRALVFAACPLNKTKHVYGGALEALTPIPDNIVDYLVAQLRDKAIDSENCDYSPITSYLAPTIEAQLGLYGRSGDYRDLQNLMSLITPSQFKHQMKPDYHPDRIPDGEGISYIQAITSKLGADPSVSLELHAELLTLITQKLWSSPLPIGDLEAHINSIQGQRYSNTGKPVFVYNPNATSIPLVSINKNPFMPVYRTLDDQYILAKPTGSVELIKGIQNFKRAIATPNYQLLIDSKPVQNPNQIARATELMETATLKYLAYKDAGTYYEDGSLYYNTYTPTKFLGIIRGTYLQERKYIVGSTPTIDSILKNITADHDGESMRDKLEQFIAHKLKTLAYSPIVFQIMGKRGVGKGLFMQLLDTITNSTTMIKLNTSNSQFNSDTAGKMFINEDEGIVTSQLVNTLKELSGNKNTRIEGKGVDAYMARNIATYICTTNKTSPMAEVVDDRRFVTLSSFTANKLSIDPTRMALEAEEWCLRLRDTILTNVGLYVDANYWHDEIHKTAFLEKSEHTEHAPSKLAHIVHTMYDHSGEELYSMLTEVLGDGFHYYISRSTLLSIALYKNTRPVRHEDKATLTHTITAQDLKAVELGQYLSEDKNMQKYNKRMWMLRLQLSENQVKAFSQVEAIIEELQ